MAISRPAPSRWACTEESTTGTPSTICVKSRLWTPPAVVRSESFRSETSDGETPKASALSLR